MFYINVYMSNVPNELQGLIKELLEDNGAADCECSFDLCYNIDNGHVFISFDRYATNLLEALCDVSYELEASGLLNYVSSIERA